MVSTFGGSTYLQASPPLLAKSKVKGAGGFFSLVVVTFGPSKEKLSLIFTNEDKGMNITVPILSRYGH